MISTLTEPTTVQYIVAILCAALIIWCVYVTVSEIGKDIDLKYSDRLEVFIGTPVIALLLISTVVGLLLAFGYGVGCILVVVANLVGTS